MVTVERATEDDFEGVLAIDYAITQDNSRQHLLAEAIRNREVIVAKKGQTRVGFAHVDRSLLGRLCLRYIAVHPEHRGEGITRELLAYIHKTHPDEPLFAAIIESDAEEQALVQKLGFEEVGHVERFGHNGETTKLYYKRPFSMTHNQSN